ncbi:hypothetical protein CEE39_00750 [bacterium (candidate division B38) B3_B38]|nr:MAG: hypothetical protein CEE39_00750 [bacterium (candidate division B38) B3_B38]
MFYRILITIIAVSICLSSFAVDLSAQEKEDDKRLEITGYLGTVQHFYMLFVGLGLEYFLSPRVSVDVEINYLPHIAFVNIPRNKIKQAPWDWTEIFSMAQDKYRLLWDINFLFYLKLSELKRAEGLYFTIGTGYMYDRMQATDIHLKTLEQYKYGYGQLHYQIGFGVGYKLYIKEDWALRILYKIHNPPDELMTRRLTLGLSYRF